MKLLSLIAFFILWFGAHAQNLGKPGDLLPRVQATEATNYVGKDAIVIGKIVDVHKTDRVTQLNFEKPFPKQVFTAVVFQRSFTVFTNLESLKEKTVEVTGKIAEYRGSPQIILTNQDQVKVVSQAK